MTQEFHISITPVRDNEYLVRTEQVEPGVPLAEEQLVWPVDQWLEQTRQLMNDPLLGLLRGQSAGISAGHLTSVSGFMELGRQLYQHLFQGILRDSWMTAQGIAQHRDQVLRLRLGLKGKQLPKLPWEVMHGHTKDGLVTTHPVATGVDVLFSRYQLDRHIARSGMVTAPNKSSVVRVLMVLALPADQDQLELDHEARQLQHELRLQSEHLQEHVVGTLPDIQVSILKHPSRTQLAQALEQAQYHVLHYAGHSDLGSDGGKLYLVDQHGLTETLTGDDLAGLLVNNGIQMAVFNSCRGGHTANGSKKAKDQSDRTLTDALVRRGIPAVLAMAERIPDGVALELTRFFYRNLKQGYPVDLSLSRARQALLAAYGSNQLYWALPTLYLHPDFDGYLTVGDRLLDNPADTFSRIPQINSPSLLDWETAPIPDSAPLPHPVGMLELSENGLDADAQMGDGGCSEEMTVSSSAHSAAFIPETDILSPPSEHDLDSISSATDVDLYGLEETQNGDDDFLLSPEEMVELTQDAGRELEDLSESSPESSPEHLPEHLSGHPPEYLDDSPSDGSELERETADQEENSVVVTEFPTRMLPPAAGESTHANTIQTTQVDGGKEDADLALVHQPDRPQAMTTAPSVQIAARTDEDGSRVARRRLGPPLWLYQIAGGAAAALAIALVGSQVYGEWIVQDPDKLTPQTTMDLVSDARNQLAEGNLQAAGEILEKVDTMALGESQVLFLQGRLIWEQLRTDAADRNLSVEDARGFWEEAVSQDSEPLYYNALGFALYAEGRLNDAVEAWRYSLEELENQGEVVVSEVNHSSSNTHSSIDVPVEAISHPDALTAYAGIALALAQLAVESPQIDQQVDAMSKVSKIQQVIRSSSPAMFDPENLRANWLWTESTIMEWEHLSQVQFQ
ncbi:MAG: CHAT domain-containing protein [Leptolyngbyaceae cyanobacterium]